MTLLLSVNTYANTEYDEVGLPIIERFSAEKNKGINENWWLLQGPNGLIYNGTGTGINLWDGESWSFYRSPNKSIVRAITSWKDNRLYAGTIDDIGFYHANSNEQLHYTSLVANWPKEQKQFGETWSVAANSQGLVFITEKLIIFWDGQQLTHIPRNSKGKLKIFSLNDKFWLKRMGDPALSNLIIENETLRIVATPLNLPLDLMINKLLLDQQDMLVAFSASKGIYKQNSKNQFEHQSSANKISTHGISDAIQASDGFYYVATHNGGFFILDEKLQILRRYGKEHDIGGNKFYAIMEDFQGNIWLSGVPDIVKITPPHKYSQFKTESGLANRLTLFQNRVTKAGYGLFQFQASQDPLVPPKFVQLLQDTQLNWDFTTFKNHLFYAGRSGIIALPILPDSTLGDPFKVVAHETGRAFILDHKNQMLFASTMEGLHKIVFQNGKFETSKVKGTEDSIIDLALDDKGVIWGGTASQELYKIEGAQQQDGQVKVSKFDGAYGIGPNNVVPYMSSRGLIIGTNDGLMDYQQDRLSPLQFLPDFPAIFNTPGQDVFKLNEDSQQRLWYRIGGHSGFLQLDQSQPLITNESLFKPFKHHGYKGFYSSSKDIVWFISARGEIFRINIQLALNLPTQGFLNIRSIINIDTSELLFGGVNSPVLPDLDQKQNSLRFTYALADNTDLKQAKYRYRLLGSINEQWSNWSIETQKDFTQLSGADYTFEIEAQDAWGRVSEQSIAFNVLPPWYLSPFAWFVYIIIGLILLAITSWLSQKWRTKALEQRNQELQQIVTARTADIQQKSQQLEQQQILKDRFFSNVSHEFRTPITLAMAPLQELLSTGSTLENHVRVSIQSALKNSKKMLELIAQVLDIQKLESGSFTLKVAKYNLIHLIEKQVERFTPWAEQLHQKITFNTDNTAVELYFDLEQIDRCLSNLLSNAVKYSGDGSLININLNHTKEHFVGIEVSDNGPGIEIQDLERVFERYYQGQVSQKVVQPGTGIGLALVKEISQLHLGDVEVLADTEVGSTFVLWLRKGKGHFKTTYLINTPLDYSMENDRDTDVFSPAQRSTSSINRENEAGISDVTSLLVVDDNLELQDFIGKTLAANYRVYFANNGKVGLEKAKSLLPDLIISDVLMPIMDGVEMVKLIKSCHATATIPVILLTAKATKRETVEGLTAGADDYLTKPFDTSELIARVDTILKNRKAVRSAISAEFYTQQINDKESFEQKLKRLIRMNMSDPEFSPDKLAPLMAMSKRNLLRHCKQDCDKSVIQIITEHKMEMAISLLSKNQQNVSEVAYACGYESLAYFSRVFKKAFGYSPSTKEH
jgi:signal transduction histidine kinase/AraC-like DNA-binding protein